VIGLGRCIPRIQRVNAETDINIVAATGLYTYNEVPFYFHYRGPGTPLDGEEPMVDMFVHDITEGIADTGVKAAILKCTTDELGPHHPGCRAGPHGQGRHRPADRPDADRQPPPDLRAARRRLLRPGYRRVNDLHLARPFGTITLTRERRWSS